MRYPTWKMNKREKDQSLLSAVMTARGFTGETAREAFLATPLTSLHDPFLLQDMDKAVSRIENALEAHEKIAVYGDYDVDGTTASALLVGYLRSRQADCTYFIPHRTEQGYGLHAPTLEQLRAGGVTLLITVDVGVTAFEAVDAANAVGLDVVITDHHSCRDTLPQAVAVVNPKRLDNLYPFTELAGVGVAFKLVCALAGAEHLHQMMADYGDLVALGTVADVMSMTGENRILVTHGLQALNEGGRPGLTQLTLCVGLQENQPINATTISFSMAPTLNAAGRMADASLAVELMLTDDSVEAQQIAQKLVDLNNQRRTIEGEMFDEVVRLWERVEDKENLPAIVMWGADWHPGITGIVCTRLMERYHKPVLLAAGPKGKGSARSPNGICLTRLLEACAPTLENFGGHAAAAGFTVEPYRMAEFQQAVYAAMETMPPRAVSEDVLCVDAAAFPEEITKQTFLTLQQLGPFGPQNQEPVLVLSDVMIQQVTFLKGGKHVKLMVGENDNRFPVICFNFSREAFPFEEGDRVDIAFVLTLNYFRGNVSIQLELRDIRLGTLLTARFNRERAPYRKFKEGQPLTPGEATEIYPVREDMVALWRQLNRRCNTLCHWQVPLHTLVREVAAERPHINAARILVALDVFKELTLLQFQEDGDCFAINLCGDNRKVNLLTSGLLKRLTACMGAAICE